jgi:predicted glycosyltransferase
MMVERRGGTRSNSRVLIYSHDSFGLGHLRRCRAISHALVEHNKDLSVLILTGSPIIGSFDFRARVDFVRIPGVIKLRNGDYTSLSLLIDIEETLAMRQSIIHHTADNFDPDIFIVDKEPLGLRGEVKNTLMMLKDRESAGPGLARRDGRAGPAGAGVGPQERAAGAARSL